MKMIMISYNESIEEEVTEVLTNCGLKNYTRINGVFGRGETSGTHLGNDIWPGRNNLLLVVGEKKASQQLLACIRELRKKLGQEGLKAFLWDLEEVT